MLMRSSICCKTRGIGKKKEREREENGYRLHWGCLILLIFDAVQRRATDGPNFDWTITPPIRIFYFYYFFFQFTDIIGQGDAHCKQLCRYSEMLMFALNSTVLSIRGSQVSYEPVSPTFTTEVLSALAGKGGILPDNDYFSLIVAVETHICSWILSRQVSSPFSLRLQLCLLLQLKNKRVHDHQEAVNFFIPGLTRGLLSPLPHFFFLLHFFFLNLQERDFFLSQNVVEISRQRKIRG